MNPIEKPPVEYLAVLQLQISYDSPGLGLWRIVPAKAPTHLVCGGGGRVWGGTLCGLAYGRGGVCGALCHGLTPAHSAARPCWRCVHTARLFPGAPVLGLPELADPVAEALGVPVLSKLPPTPALTPPRSTP